MKNKILKTLFKLEDLLLMLCLAVMGIVLFSQVIARYCFRSPLIWSEELARYLQVWITFFGIGYGIRNKAHIEMTFLYNRCNEKFQKISTLITDIIIIGCIIIFLPGAFRFLMDQNLIKSSAMEVNMALIYFPLIFGMITGVLYLIGDIVSTVKSLISK